MCKVMNASAWSHFKHSSKPMLAGHSPKDEQPSAPFQGSLNAEGRGNKTEKSHPFKIGPDTTTIEISAKDVEEKKHCSIYLNFIKKLKWLTSLSCCVECRL
ncbi:hypothetical protein CISIN_1g034265mg [Citrus sinensis]|uniref:Uncharacterized protein n=1 Tax=Citrus sinensis TaxID=2711 RepID=A0A067ET46_CITSI|nr:hypothetical protein CISIN_1g034265mg [Citrus sinensis]